MKKITNILSLFGFSLFVASLVVSKAYADVPVPPGPVRVGSIVMVVAGVGVGIVALVSLLVIRAIRRKRNVVAK